MLITQVKSLEEESDVGSSCWSKVVDPISRVNSSGKDGAGDCVLYLPLTYELEEN